MDALVGTFQARLQISRGEASWRVVGFCLFSIAVLAVIAATAAFFPRQGSYSDRIPVLPGQHTQVSQILDGEVLVERDQFLQLAKGKEAFIALGDGAISYMVKVDNVSYRHDQNAGYDKIRYGIGSQTIHEGVVVRELHRNLEAVTIGLFIVEPLLLIVVLLFLVLTVQHKRHGYRGPYNYVWIG